MSSANLEQYLQEFDSYSLSIYYRFYLQQGGLADCLKFFAHLLEYCIRNKIRLFYVHTHIPIEKYIRVKYPKMVVSQQQLTDNVVFLSPASHLSECVDPNIKYVTNPAMFYNGFDFDRLLIPFSQIFEFHPDVIVRANELFSGSTGSTPESYVAVHLRLGDKYLETDPRYVACRNDERKYQQNTIISVIGRLISESKTVLFLCDNKKYRASIQALFPSIYITNADIGHTSFLNTTNEQVKNTVAEFYLMTRATKIFAASYSGFSLAAAKFNDIPIEKIYTE